jgi:hypothetical protein
MKILGSAAIQTPEVFVAPPKRLILNHEHPKLGVTEKFDR